MPKMTWNQRMVQIGTECIKWIGFLLTGVLFIYSFFRTTLLLWDNDYKERAVVVEDKAWLCLLGIVIFMLFLYYLKKSRWWERVSVRRIHVLSMVFFVIVGVAYVYLSKNHPNADQLMVSQVAAQTMGHAYLSFGEQYLQGYPHQLGIIWLFSWIYRIFHTQEFVVIMYVNVFLMAGIVELMYQIVRTRLSEDAQKAYFLVCCLSVNLILYCTFVYGTIIGLFFAVLGLFAEVKFFEKKKVFYMLGAACSFAFSLIAKENYLIFLIAGILYWLGKSMQRFTWKNLVGVCLFLAVLAPTGIQRYYEKESGVQFASGIPSIAYVTMGLQEGPIANGWHNQYDADLYQNTGGNVEKMQSLAVADLKERVDTFVENPQYAVEFFKEKFCTQWNDPTFQSLWNSSKLGWYSEELPKITHSLYYGKLNAIVHQWLNLFVMMIWLGNVLFVILFRKKTDLEYWIFVLCFIGGVTFHLMWEAKALYAFPYYVIMLPNAVMGLSSILERVEAKRKGN